MDRRRDGEPIYLYCAFNELDEARFVVNRIKTWQDNGGARPHVPSLPQQRPIARAGGALLQASMPYRIYGGVRFFDRRRSQIVLLSSPDCNRHDDASFERQVNTPTRGIGDGTRTGYARPRVSA
ncbi:3'-5' exonuclease [Shigella flexneri]